MPINQIITEKEARALAEAYQVSIRTLRRWQEEIGTAVRDPKAVAAMLLSHRRANTDTLVAVNQQIQHSQS